MDRRLLVLALGMFALGTDNFALSFAVMAPVMATVAGSWPRRSGGAARCLS